MKTISISDELYNELKEISHGIATQDNRCTAKPYMFQVMEDERIYGIEDADTWIWVSDDADTHLEHDYQLIVDHFNDYASGLPDNFKEMFDDICGYDLKEFMESAGYRKCGFITKQVYGNAFFTEKACKSHIQRNGHNLNNPKDYLSYCYRNPEMEAIFKLMDTIKDQ